MATPLNLTADVGADGTPRVTASGEIDLSNIDAFTDALETASAGTRGPITVDLSAVKYLDSAGIRLVYRLRESLRARGQELRLVIPKYSAPGAALRLAGVTNHLRPGETLGETLRPDDGSEG